MDGATELVAALAGRRQQRDEPHQLQRLLNFLGHGPEPKSEQPLRIGVLGASQVATYALIWPARRLADVHVAAVAAREAGRAAAFAKQHGIPASYGSYQALLDDPTLDAIYVATPNGLHGCWAEAALRAGKHVLCEKPFTANADEARSVQDVAKKCGLLCREAFHYKEHPANQAVAQLLQSGVIGQLRELAVQVLVPRWAFAKDDIRFQAHLAGGSLMDAGCYCIHTLRFFPGCSRPLVVDAAASKLVDGGRVDGRMTATLRYPAAAAGAKARSGGSGVLGASTVGRLVADLRYDGLWPRTRFSAVGTMGQLEMDNFIMPFLGHTLSITRTVSSSNNDESSSDTSSSSSSAGGGGGAFHAQQRTTLGVYGSGESNYYYQLQRFVSDLRVLQDGHASQGAQRAVRAAMAADAADAIDNLALIDSIYDAAGLPRRQPTRVSMGGGMGDAGGLLPGGAARVKQ